MIKRYTANQPLFLGGQIYMWNRYLESKNLVHMIEAQFTKFGHQSRIELLTKDGNKIWAMLPLADRNFKPIGEIELHEPHINVDKLIKTIKTLYPEKKVAEPIFHQDLLELLWANRYKPLGWFNVDSTNLIYYYLFGGY